MPQSIRTNKETTNPEAIPYSLTAADRRDLEWYASDPPVVAGIRQSDFSAQLERAKLFGRAYRPCKGCGGRTNPEWRHGSGFQPSCGRPYHVALRDYRRRMIQRYELVVAYGDRADRLRLLGVEVVTMREVAKLFPELEDYRTVCTECDGLGVVEDDPARPRSRRKITAFPTKSSVNGIVGDFATLDGPAIEKWGRVRKRLAAAEGHCAGSTAVLLAYYGPGGTHRALWRWTSAGRRLLASEDGGAAALTQGTTEDWFASLLTQQRTLSEPVRGRLLDQAQRESIELVKAAGRAWNKGAKA